METIDKMTLEELKQLREEIVNKEEVDTKKLVLVHNAIVNKQKELKKC